MATLYLIHHGIEGQKWGVRRFQDKQGHLTQAGAERYGVEHLGAYDGSSVNPRKLDRKHLARERKRLYKTIDKNAKHYGDNKSAEGRESTKAAKAYVDQYLQNKYGSQTFANFQSSQKQKIVVGAAAATAVLAGAGLIAFNSKGAKKARADWKKNKQNRHDFNADWWNYKHGATLGYIDKSGATRNYNESGLSKKDFYNQYYKNTKGRGTRKAAIVSFANMRTNTFRR